ncbi:MAG: glycogen/starch synthase [Bacteroidota bacterium]
MASATRILFLSGDVVPFTKATDLASLVRRLPEQIQEAGDYETRIMMPRYGTVSERRNRLHEVIRLSGSDIPMGEDVETLKVKVASIPGVRLQVYFMDNRTYFKRKGLWSDKKGVVYEDNPARALFFGRAVMATLSKLGWSPDIVHTFGWASGLVPALLRTEFKADPLFAKAKIVHTPDGILTDASPLPAELVERLGLPADLTGQALNEAALAYADAALYPPHLDAPDGQAAFSGDAETAPQEAMAFYDQLVGVPA